MLKIIIYFRIECAFGFSNFLVRENDKFEASQGIGIDLDKNKMSVDLFPEIFMYTIFHGGSYILNLISNTSFSILNCAKK